MNLIKLLILIERIALSILTMFFILLFIILTGCSEDQHQEQGPCTTLKFETGTLISCSHGGVFWAKDPIEVPQEEIGNDAIQPIQGEETLADFVLVLEPCGTGKGEVYKFYDGRFAIWKKNGLHFVGHGSHKIKKCKFTIDESGLKGHGVVF